jgi:hypothetical protein
MHQQEIPICKTNTAAMGMQTLAGIYRLMTP